MARIEPLEMPFAPALAQRMARLLPPTTTPPALFRAVARNAPLFAFLVDSGWLGPTGLLDRHAVAPALREALILRVCVAAGNDYEWRLHVGTISRRMGLGDAQIADTRSPVPDPTLWDEPALAAMALADALVRSLSVGEALYARLRESFDEPTLIELTQLVGLYTGVAMMVALVRPDADACAAPLPAPQETVVKQADRPDSVHRAGLAAGAA
jgi:alkylhydroperoxidase family enzyme